MARLIPFFIVVVFATSIGHAQEPEIDKEKILGHLKPQAIGIVRKITRDNRHRDPRERRAEAEVVITEVYLGSDKLKGRTFTTWCAPIEAIPQGTMADSPGDNFPMLEPGDMAILEFSKADPEPDDVFLLARTQHPTLTLNNEFASDLKSLNSLLEGYRRRGKLLQSLANLPDEEFSAGFLHGLRSPEDDVVAFTVGALIESQANPDGNRIRKLEDRRAVYQKLIALRESYPLLTRYYWLLALDNSCQTDFRADPNRFDYALELLKSDHRWNEEQATNLSQRVISKSLQTSPDIFDRTLEEVERTLLQETTPATVKSAILDSAAEAHRYLNLDAVRKTRIVNIILKFAGTTTDRHEFMQAVKTFSIIELGGLTADQRLRIQELRVPKSVPDLAPHSRDDAESTLKELRRTLNYKP